MTRYRLSIPEYDYHPGWTDPLDTASVRAWAESQVPTFPGYSWFWEVIDDGGYVPPTPDAILTGQYRAGVAPYFDNRLWVSLYRGQACLAGPIVGTNRTGVSISSYTAADLADLYDPV